MPDEIIIPLPETNKPLRFRFHPIVRYFMIFLGIITTGYSIYFIAFLIPQISNFTMFFKGVSVIVLYVALSTLYNHLFGLNSIIISDEFLEIGFLLRKRIVISWDNLLRMDIYKIVTHYWKITYRDKKGLTKIFKTSLAFPGIIKILLAIQDKKPEIELNELLKQVLIYKRNTNSQPSSEAKE